MDRIVNEEPSAIQMPELNQGCGFNHRLIIYRVLMKPYICMERLLSKRNTGTVLCDGLGERLAVLAGL
jgi:hypothetical protein